MKCKLLLFLLSFFAFQLLQAQHWCPPGATWNFEAINPYQATDTSQTLFITGYDKAAYSSDTIINGQSCKVITDTGYNENDNTGMVIYNPIFTYGSGDTVYFLTGGQFLPYFYFGCHTGDTLLVPWANTIVATYVDSTGIMVINGDSLRFYDYRAVDSPYSCTHVVGGTSRGEIVERIGSVTVGPGNNSFSLDFSCEEYFEGYFLHCYQDDSFALYSTDTTESCNYILTGVANLIALTQINIYPNPTSNYCTLQLSGESGTFTASIFDVTGREVMPLFSNQRFSTYSFNVSSLPSGLYFVRVKDKSGNEGVAKFIKQE
jgi:hypothetical protein